MCMDQEFLHTVLRQVAATNGKLLGHEKRGVTVRHYIRQPDAALIAAADLVARRIKECMAGTEMADVVPLPVHRA